MSNTARKVLSDYPPHIQDQIERALHGRTQPVLANSRPLQALVDTKTQAKPKKGCRAIRTRNGGTWTEAHYWGALRSHLRRLFRFWKPAQDALKSARVPYSGGRTKWAYLCSDCNKLFRRQGVQIDHIEPCGQLTKLEHLPDFLRRLTPEDPKAFRVRCIKCHQDKTNQEANPKLTGPTGPV